MTRTVAATGRVLPRSLLALIALALLLAGPGARCEDWIYRAQPGDNLWDLSKRYLRSVQYFQSLWAYNNIEDPTRLEPGQEIRMPMRWLKRGPTQASVVVVQGTATRIGASGEEPLVPGT